MNSRDALRFEGSVLHKAVQNGHPDRVALLLEEGASIEAWTNTTIPHYTLRQGMVILILWSYFLVEAPKLKL